MDALLKKRIPILIACLATIVACVALLSPPIRSALSIKAGPGVMKTLLAVGVIVLFCVAIQSARRFGHVGWLPVATIVLGGLTILFGWMLASDFITFVDLIPMLTSKAEHAYGLPQPLARAVAAIASLGLAISLRWLFSSGKKTAAMLLLCSMIVTASVAEYEVQKDWLVDPFSGERRCFVRTPEGPRVTSCDYKFDPRYPGRPVEPVTDDIIGTLRAGQDDPLKVHPLAYQPGMALFDDRGRPLYWVKVYSDHTVDLLLQDHDLTTGGQLRPVSSALAEKIASGQVTVRGPGYVPSSPKAHSSSIFDATVDDLERLSEKKR